MPLDRACEALARLRCAFHGTRISLEVPLWKIENLPKPTTRQNQTMRQMKHDSIQPESWSLNNMKRLLLSLPTNRSIAGDPCPTYRLQQRTRHSWDQQD